MPHGLDRGLGAELLAQPSDAHVDDIRSGIEAVAPDLGEEPFTTDDLACVREEVVEQPELAVREIGDAPFDASLTPCQIELEAADPHGRRVLGPSMSQVDAHAGDELIERERLRQVVVRPQLKAAEL